MSSLAPTGPTTLMERIAPSFKTMSTFNRVLLAFVGTAILTLSAKISIPFYPIPTTMQTFAVISLGCVFGSRLAAATVALYIFEGALGLPVFQGHTTGLAIFMGPTSGYLVGFVSAAYVVGRLFEEGFGRNALSAALLFTLGAVIIDIPGLTWLTSFAGLDIAKGAFLSYQYAFLLKSGLFAVIIPALWHHHSASKTTD